MSNNRLFELKAFTGQLGLEKNILPLSFRVAIDGSGEVEFEFGPIPLTEETKFVFFGWHREGSDFVHFVLSGVAEDGTAFETDSLYFNGLGESSDASGTRMTPTARCSKAVLSLKLSQPAKSPGLRIRLRGFENFASHHADCPLGHVAVAGQHSFEDSNAITGYISIKANSEPTDIRAWRTDADKFLEHVRSVMSLAASSLLRAPMTEFFHGHSLEVRVMSQSRQISSSFRVVHFLAQEDIFNAAVQSFFRPPIEVKRLSFAIEWFAMEAAYNEVRLINAMTALENLVDSNVEGESGLIEPKRLFEKTTRRALRNVIRACLAKWPPADAEEALVEFNEKLSDLNRRPFLRKLQGLAQRWCVPLDGITDENLRAAKNARDKVVHRGQYYEDLTETDANLWSHVTIIREVAVRFLLTAIGYKGRYISYVGGYHDAEFPPSKPKTS